nr:G-protein coupled receptor 55-like [Danio rerio]|eukprot:XP_002667698.2 G-protein coupled receptor 55-like [Danio rerio]
MSNCSLSITAGIQNFQLAVQIPTFIFGVPANIYVIIMFCRRTRSAWTDMNIYISNMAVADCVMLVILPIRIMSIYENTLVSRFWDQTNKELCYVLVSVHYVNMYVSIFTITAISIVRFIAIKYPLKAREIFSRRKALVVCALIWLVTCSLSVAFHRVDDPKHNSTIKCFQKNKKEELPLTFILVLNVVGFISPFLIMTFCSIRVIFTLRKQLDIGSRAEKMQCIFIMVANLCVFVVCFFPVHFGFLLKYITQAHKYSCDAQIWSHNFVHAAICVSSMNCALDCVTYYFATRTSWTIRCCRQKTHEGYKCHYSSTRSSQ